MGLTTGKAPQGARQLALVARRKERFVPLSRTHQSCGRRRPRCRASNGCPSGCLRSVDDSLAPSLPHRFSSDGLPPSAPEPETVWPFDAAESPANHLAAAERKTTAP